MLERNIERGIILHLNEVWGCKSYKLNGDGDRGKPDRLVLCASGFAFFIEFKKPNEKPRTLQLREIKKLRKLGFFVFVIDQLQEGKDIVDFFLSTCLPTESY